MTEQLSASNSTTFPTGPGGYTCALCKTYVPFGGYHQCAGYSPPPTLPTQIFYTILPVELDEMKKQMEELKKTVDEIKELLADNK